MSKRQLLASVLVAALCTAILVLFTEVERSIPRWLSCGSLPNPTSPNPVCRR